MKKTLEDADEAEVRALYSAFGIGIAGKRVGTVDHEGAEVHNEHLTISRSPPEFGPGMRSSTGLLRALAGRNAVLQDATDAVQNVRPPSRSAPASGKAGKNLKNGADGRSSPIQGRPAAQALAKQLTRSSPDLQTPPSTSTTSFMLPHCSSSSSSSSSKNRHTSRGGDLADLPTLRLWVESPMPRAQPVPLSTSSARRRAVRTQRTTRKVPERRASLLDHLEACARRARPPRLAAYRGGQGPRRLNSSRTKNRSLPMASKVPPQPAEEASPKKPSPSVTPVAATSTPRQPVSHDDPFSAPIRASSPPRTSCTSTAVCRTTMRLSATRTSCT